MPKNKRCPRCKKVNLKVFYTRHYYKGYSFKSVAIGETVNKSKLEPQGLFCERCGYRELKDDWYFTDIKEEQEEQLRKLREYQWKYNLHEYKYTHTKKEVKEEIAWTKDHCKSWEIVRKHRLITWYSAKEVHSYLKGLKVGGRISDKHWSERLERETLTNEQILKKAESIKQRKNLGYKD